MQAIQIKRYFNLKQNLNFTKNNYNIQNIRHHHLQYQNSQSTKVLLIFRHAKITKYLNKAFLIILIVTLVLLKKFF